jgi:hypothetical protein
VKVILEKQNITLSLPHSVLHRLKKLAVKRHLSVARLMILAAENMLAEETEYEAARKRQTALIEKGFNLGFCEPANRGELHERKPVFYRV